MNAFGSALPTQPHQRGIVWVEGLDPETFHREYVRRGVPVVLRGFASDWPAVRTWSLASLADACGSAPVRVQVIEPDDPAQEIIKTLPLDESIRAMLDPARSGTRHYIQQISLDPVSPSLRAALRSVEEYLGPRYPIGRERWRDEPRFWIGPAGTVTPLHMDLSHNFFVQIVGRKRFTLLDPSQSAALGFPNYRLAKMSQCEVDLEHPDLERFPAFASTRREVIELSPGDALFLPHSWWHHVRALEPSVSLSHWWLSAGMLFEQRRYWFHRFRRRVLRACGALQT